MGGRGPKDGQAKGASDLRQKEVASLRQTLGHFEMKMSEMSDILKMICTLKSLFD